MGREERNAGRRLKQQKEAARKSAEQSQAAEREAILALGKRGSGVVNEAVRRLESAAAPTESVRAEYKKRGLFGGSYEWGIFDAWKIADGAAHLTRSGKLILPHMTSVYTMNEYANHVAVITKLNYSTAERARRSYPEPTLRAIVEDLERIAAG